MTIELQNYDKPGGDSSCRFPYSWGVDSRVRSPAGFRAACAFCAAPGCSLRHIAVVRGGLGGASGVPVLLGLSEFFLARLAAPSGGVSALSLALVVVAIVLSQFKHGVVMMTLTFVDLMVVDRATFSFLMAIFPGLAWKVLVAVLLLIAILAVLWRSEPFRTRRSMALAGCIGCATALAIVSTVVPLGARR